MLNKTRKWIIAVALVSIALTIFFKSKTYLEIWARFLQLKN